MNWKILLNQNLLILEYPFGNNLPLHDRINLFKSTNNSALEEIVKFCINKVDPGVIDDLNKSYNKLTDKKVRINYMRRLFNWSTEIISKTFKESTFNSSIFVSAKGACAYEILAKLTSCVIKIKIEKLQNENSSDLRYPITWSNLQAIKLSPKVAISSLNDDILRERKAYRNQLDLLTERQKLFSDKLRSKKERLNQINKDIDDLKGELNLKSDILDEFCESSIDLLDWDLSTRLEESESKVNILQSKINKFLNLCQLVQDRYLERPDEVSIKIPILNDVINKMDLNLFKENGLLSFERVVKKVVNELSFNEEKYKNDLLQKENDRVKHGVLLVESSISKNLEIMCDMRKSLIELQENIKEHNDFIDPDRLKDFWKPITAREFIKRSFVNEAGDDFEGDRNSCTDNHNENELEIISDYEVDEKNDSFSLCKNKSFLDDENENFQFECVSRADNMFVQNLGDHFTSNSDSYFLNRSDSSIAEFMENNS